MDKEKIWTTSIIIILIVLAINLYNSQEEIEDFSINRTEQGIVDKCKNIELDKTVKCLTDEVKFFYKFSYFEVK